MCRYLAELPPSALWRYLEEGALGSLYIFLCTNQFSARIYHGANHWAWVLQSSLQLQQNKSSRAPTDHQRGRFGELQCPYDHVAIACVTGSVILVFPVDTTKACYTCGISWGFKARLDGALRNLGLVEGVPARARGVGTGNVLSNPTQPIL